MGGSGFSGSGRPGASKKDLGTRPPHALGSSAAAPAARHRDKQQPDEASATFSYLGPSIVPPAPRASDPRCTPDPAVSLPELLAALHCPPRHLSRGLVPRSGPASVAGTACGPRSVPRSALSCVPGRHLPAGLPVLLWWLEARCPGHRGPRGALVSLSPPPPATRRVQVRPQANVRESSFSGIKPVRWHSGGIAFNGPGLLGCV